MDHVNAYIIKLVRFLFCMLQEYVKNNDGNHFVVTFSK